jgi:hypothetical protein
MPSEINPDLYTKEVLNKFFPKAHLKSSTIWESETVKPNFFDGEISTYNIFKLTPYEYKGRNRFIHFTSIEKLKAILTSGYLRMASLDSLQDTEEVHFAGKVIDPNSFYDLDVVSENLFSLSACESNTANIFNKKMWMEYGDQYRGCILQYSFSKMELFRSNFGVIRYGEKHLSDLKKLVIMSHSFYQEYGFSVSQLPVFLRTILSFHKNQNYDFEREIRLLIEPEFLPDSCYEPDFCQKKGIKKYYKLPFSERNELPVNTKFDQDTILHHFPQIELNRIILGPQSSGEDKEGVETLIKHYLPNSEIEIHYLSTTCF